MADATVDWTLDGMNSKYTLQEKILDRFEKDTGHAIVDPNCPAVELIDAFSSIGADIVKSIEETVRPAIYPARATSVVDLYKHLSDYDYLDIFASPSNTTILLVLDKNYTIIHSVDVPGTNYRKIVIPKESIITIGDHKFGLYYPIEIRSNMDTGNISVVYDTSVRNPLKTLASNVLDFEVRKYNVQELLYIKIPVYQFTIQTLEEQLATGSGYYKVVDYPDKFYAIRATADIITNRDHDSSEEDNWVNQELHLCVGGQVYDAQTPTLVFTPDLQNNQLILEIPQIYFTRSLIRGNLRIEIYTTEGKIDYTIPTDTTETETIDMFTNLVDEETTLYATPFQQMPALSVMPLGDRVTGGSDGVDYDTLRRRVINGTIRSKTLQTPDDITAYFTDQGYVTTTLKDGVTDRIFICHAPVKTSDGEIVGAASIGTLFDFRSENLRDYGTIVSCGNDKFTVLPSTRYRFDTDRGICRPLTTQELLKLNQMVPNAKVEEFNSNIYTLSPFHLHVDTSSRYPLTVSYDMTDAGVQSQEFVASRETVTATLSLNAVSMVVVKGVEKDSYKLRVLVARTNLDTVFAEDDIDGEVAQISKPIAAVVPDGDQAGKKNIRALIALKNDDNIPYFTEAEYFGRENDIDIFELPILSDYKFSQANNNHTVKLSIFDKSGNKQESDFFLTSEIRVMLCIDGDIENIGRTDYQYLETDFTGAGTVLANINNLYCLSEYKLMCKFGSAVNELDQRINLTYSEMTYKKYCTTKFLELENPDYKRNSDGSLTVHRVGPAYAFFPEQTTYYYREGDVYNPVEDITSPEAFASATAVYGQLYYTNKGGDKTGLEIDQTYQKGTLLCVTKTTPLESKTLNRMTVQNYLNCKAKDSGGQDVVIRGEGQTNMLLAIEDCPVIPSFKIEEATPNSSGDAIAVGEYELDLALTKRGGLSSPMDKWVLTGECNDENPRTGIPARPNTILMSGNAIRFVLQQLTDGQKVDKSNIGDISRVKAPAGTFVLVANDHTFDDVEPGIEWIGTDASVRSGKVAGLYYCVDAEAINGRVQSSKWVMVAHGQNFADMYEEAGNCETEHNRTYGYVYTLSAYSKPTPTVSSQLQQFVSFLNTKTIEGDYIVPDFTRFNLDEEIDGETVVNYGWKTKVNAYPWDAKRWFEVTTYTDGTMDVPFNTYEFDATFKTTFMSSKLTRYCAYTTAQFMLDEKGQLQEDPSNPRAIEYLIDMTQIDAKLAETSANRSNNIYQSSVTSTLRAHFSNLATAKNNLFTNTRLLFEPTKSVGFATFTIGAERTDELQLDISVGFKIHVTQSTADDATLLQSVREKIIAIVDQKIESGYLNCTEVASQILQDIGDTVKHVDVLGINGDPTIQTLKCDELEVRPHLKHVLKVLEGDDVTIDVERGLTLEVVVSD